MNAIDELDVAVLWGLSSLPERQRNLVCDHFGLMGREPHKKSELNRKYGRSKGWASMEINRTMRSLARYYRKHPELLEPCIESGLLSIFKNTLHDRCATLGNRRPIKRIRSSEQLRDIDRTTGFPSLQPGEWFPYLGNFRSDPEMVIDGVPCKKTKGGWICQTVKSKWALRPRNLFHQIINGMARRGFIKIDTGYYVRHVGSTKITVKTISYPPSSDFVWICASKR